MTVELHTPESVTDAATEHYINLWQKTSSWAIRLMIERDRAYARLGEVRAYVERMHGQAEAASEQVRRVAAPGVAESWAELLDLLDAPLGVVLDADRKDAA